MSNKFLQRAVSDVSFNVDNVNVNTDSLEAKIQSTNDKLDSFSGASNNTVGDGQVKLQVFTYGRDTVNNVNRPIKVDSIGKVEIDSPSGSDINLRLDKIQNLRDDKTSTLNANTLFDGSGSLVANTLNSTTLDLGATSTAKTVHFYGKAGNDEKFDIFVSNDNSTYIRVQSIKPLVEPISSTFHYSYRMENLGRYYRISNPHPTTAITSFQMFYNITK